MGLWDWVWKALTGPSDDAPRETGRGDVLPYSADAPSADGSSAERSAVATDVQVADDSVESLGQDAWWAPPGVMLTLPADVAPMNLSIEARALQARLISHFDGHDLVLPPMPKVADKVLKHLRDSKSGAPQIAKDLSEDPVIAGDVLRMSNSVLYRGVEKIASLPAAVARLGNNALRTVMMHQSLRAAVFYAKGETLEFAKVVWENSLASAIVMRDLASFTREVEEDAFLTGLLHDIGNVIVLRLAHEQQKLTRVALDLDTFEYLCHESHQEFGELISQSWQLPQKLQTLIADHHRIPADDDPLRKERWLIIAADMICQMLGYAPTAQYDLLHSRAFKELGLVDRQDVLDWLAALPERIADTIEEL